ncbi:Pycsar system effector family protein [Streptomyces sp. NPDC058676]|uniref:Pycsar system effector family protein n=1 Tax=unclassified Streptomyces TaxID=2593676 RepID=UPI003665E6BF
MQTTDRTDENLNRAIDHTASEIARTDSKAGLLLTLDGVLVAGLGLLGKDLPVAALVASGVGVVALVAAVVLGLMVVRPRFGSPNGVQDKGSFVYWADCTDDEVAASLAEDRRIARVRVLSGIARRKMRFLQRSSDASLVAVVALAAAALITAA